MEFVSGKYKIRVFEDNGFKESSVDNIHKYDLIYLKKSDYKFSSIFGIKIFQDTVELKSAVIGSIGGATGIHDKSIIVESERLVVCCSNSVFCLSIPDLTLLWKTQADQATCFEIYEYQDSYIVHGELEISRLDRNGKILWQRSGADIFTTAEGKEDFIITDNYILATDWENKKYKFNFDGKIVE